MLALALRLNQCWISSKYLKVELSMSVRSLQRDSLASVQRVSWGDGQSPALQAERGSGSQPGVCMSACSRAQGGWRPGLLCHQCQPSLSAANSSSFQEVKQPSEFAYTCEIKISLGNFHFLSLNLAVCSVEMSISGHKLPLGQG